MKPFFFLILLSFLVVSCDSKSNKKGTRRVPLSAQVSQVTVLENQIVLKGMNFSSVTDFKLIEGPTIHNLIIESKNDSEIIAKTTTHVSLPIGQAIKFIISDAEASADFTLEVSFCRTYLNGGTFDCFLRANDKEVLAFNQETSSWRPRSVNGLSYLGPWDATTSLPPGTEAGDYYVVSVSGGNYHTGDWIIFNGAIFEKIENAQRLISVFNRTGSVTAREGDYSLTKLSDVTLTSLPTENDLLVFDGAQWSRVPLKKLVGNDTSTFSGDKTFQDKVVVSGGVKVGSSVSTCDPSKEGTIRYNNFMKVVQTCNGSTWEGP